jgi:hypothetical protein
VQTSAPTLLVKKSDFAERGAGGADPHRHDAYTVASFEHDPMGFPDWTLIALKV